MIGKQKRSLIFSTKYLSMEPHKNVRFEVLIAVTMKITVFLCQGVVWETCTHVSEETVASIIRMMGIK
jgi:hypothetical protein